MARWFETPPQNSFETIFSRLLHSALRYKKRKAHTLVISELRNTPIKGASALRTSPVQVGKSDPQEVVSLGQSQEGLPSKPNFAKADKNAEKPVRTEGLSATARGVLVAMTGLVGAMSLAGCKPEAAPPTNQVETQAQKDARAQFSRELAQIQSQMPNIQGGSGQQQSEQVTRQIIDAAKRYAQSSGQSGPGLVNELRNVMQDHPALTITTLFAVGIAGGVGLEKLGLSDGISQGVSKVHQAVKDHPIAAGVIALTAAGAAAYGINQLVNTEMSIPQLPTGPQADSLNSTFSSIEERLAANPNTNPAEIQRDVLAAVQRYQKDTGKPWQKVADEIRAFAFNHPVLAASLVASAGVATGVLLERAGVPSQVATATSVAFDSAKGTAGNVAGTVGQYIKDHPVIAGTVAVGVAAGVGYLVYNHFSPSPAPAQ